MRSNKSMQTILLAFLVSFASLSHSQPLSTSSRWIVDAKSGNRVKLTGVNWSGSLNTMIPEGLHKRPLKNIAESVASMGFNVVRLTYAIYMFTQPSDINLTVEQSLDQWNLKEAKEGMAKNNPQLLKLRLVDAQKAVIDELGAHNIMVVLDNHISMPMWCCNNYDGNGFFGDKYFDPKEWVKGLTIVAKRYKGNPTVVAMSMRNEIRGPRQNANDWYRYMQEGATAIHKENPDVLVIFSGLSFDTDLSFLKNRSLEVNLGNKLVYEVHYYSFGDPQKQWINQPNIYCENATRRLMDNAGFLFTGKKPTPLFLSEFGQNQQGTNGAENRYFSCLLAFVAETDMDWAVWTLQGSYMLREGTLDLEETYGMLDANWSHVRNLTMQKRLELIHQMHHDPKLNNPIQYVLFHPESGKCVQAGKDNIQATDYKSCSGWSHGEDGSPIHLSNGGNSSGCLTAVGDGLPVIISDDCSSQRSKWRYVSKSKLHLAAKDNKGKDLCLELDTSLVTKKCLCLGHDLKDVPKCTEDPRRQWFKLVPTNKQQ